MRQVLQELKSGQTFVVDVPAPGPKDGSVLIATTTSLVSAGTERMLVEFGRANLLSKVRGQPDRVAQVLAKMKTDGVAATLEAVEAKLSTPLPMGYCNVGRVVQDSEGLIKGQRVVSNGKHADVVSVPRNLVAAIPEEVTDEAATFCVIGAIALQGVRLASPTIGERFVVIGLGMIGLLAVQILRANGCRVLGIDRNPARLELARQFGAETLNNAQVADPTSAALAFSDGEGVDGVLIAASTPSDEPVSQAATMCRKRGRIVLLGVTGLSLKRDDFYEKELTFQVSCSYGPGRYDPAYEEKGHDYPIGFVRWSEGRNFSAILDLMRDGRIDVEPLITHRYEIDQAPDAYEALVNDPAALGIVLKYPDDARRLERVVPTATAISAPRNTARSTAVSFIGAGNYAGRVLAKAFSDAGSSLNAVVSENGVSAQRVAEKYGFALASTNTVETIADPSSGIIVVATRHDTHADLVLEALRAGRHVFVEKPLCLTIDQLEAIEAAARKESAGKLMVGFNRRFAPMVQAMNAGIQSVDGPRVTMIRINAGTIPNDHWTQDPQIGGGRIVGEACHFIDLARFLGGAPVESMNVDAMSVPGGPALAENVVISMRHANGSLSTIQYLANGPKSLPKERVEVFAAGGAMILDNFRKLEAIGWSGTKGMRSFRPDKGQTECVSRFVESVARGGPPPIALDEIIEVSRLSIEAARRAG